MSPRPARHICANCHRTLPRAASYRCPFCREQLGQPAGAPDAICPRCDTPIPRAHRGKCPCSVAAYSAGSAARTAPRQAP